MLHEEVEPVPGLAPQKFARLTWDGLRQLPIPNEVTSHCYDPVIELSFAGLLDLPEPFNSATCWIFCREAWPHNDPDFEGLAFITLVIQGDHTYSQILPEDKRVSFGVFPGDLFVTDPRCLHWLAPNNPQTNPGFIGLQWEVPIQDYESAFADLTRKLSKLGELIHPELSLKSNIAEAETDR